ncbi:MAG TPA: PadR family transcriptional regulator [Bryobacteraceae bacterium]|nr:PadR family transcriptional regulator [Bryobacteraceae bacterium]
MLQAERNDLLPGTLEMLILLTLRRGPQHGYAIAQQIKQRSEDLLQVEEGSLYPALQRILRNGWVEAKWAISATNRRIRQYRLTPAGRKQIDKEVSRVGRLVEGLRRMMRLAES